MPYSPSDSNLPDYVRKLSPKRKRQWCDVWNTSYQRAKKAGKSDKDAESSAFAQANGVVGAKVSLSAEAGASAVSIATFALDLEPYDAGEIVYRPGMLFKSGDYPDKDFAMTPDELRAAADAFTDPVAVDLEHTETPLSGKLGEVVHVEASDDGTELHGLVALPKWLDDVLDERKVSATWDRATKRLEGLALVLNPRVDEAALMAAFSAATGGSMTTTVGFAEWSTADVNDLPDSCFLFIESGGSKDDEGKTTPRSKRHFPYKDKGGKIDLPHLRNAIARIPQSNAPGLNKDALQKRARSLLEHANASIDLPLGTLEQLVEFAAARHDTPEGQMILQELHNTSARGGAVCKSSNTARMASGHESSTVQKIHDMTTEHGATCSSKKPGQMPWLFGASRRTTPKEERRMSRFEEFMAWLKGDGDENPTTSSGITATMSTAQNAEVESLKRRQTELEAENARIRAERINDQAVAFADQQIRERRAYPAEREAILSDYVQRATDDTLHGTVTFGEGEQKKTRTRVDLLKETFAARPQHGLTADEMVKAGLVALTNGVETETRTGDKPADDKRVKDLVGMTALGRTIAQSNGKH